MLARFGGADVPYSVAPLRVCAFSQNRVARARDMTARFDRARGRGRPRCAAELPSVEAPAVSKTWTACGKGKPHPGGPSGATIFPLSFALRLSVESTTSKSLPFGAIRECPHNKSGSANPTGSVFVLIFERLQNRETQLLIVQSCSSPAFGKSAIVGKSKFGIARSLAVNLQVMLPGAGPYDLLL